MPVHEEERFWLRVLFFVAVAACVILVGVIGHYSIKILQWILVIANMKG